MRCARTVVWLGSTGMQKMKRAPTARKSLASRSHSVSSLTSMKPCSASAIAELRCMPKPRRPRCAMPRCGGPGLSVSPGPLSVTVISSTSGRTFFAAPTPLSFLPLPFFSFFPLLSSLPYRPRVPKLPKLSFLGLAFALLSILLPRPPPDKLLSRRKGMAPNWLMRILSVTSGQPGTLLSAYLGTVYLIALLTPFMRIWRTRRGSVHVTTSCSTSMLKRTPS
mmetsp:Transcript_38580/g.120786  ORF Transcript_38580/g.120786 Transcript_38580/m.120786 type:complete len:222 (-) Transcript_38580:1722-2387(-)